MRCNEIYGSGEWMHGDDLVNQNNQPAPLVLTIASVFTSEFDDSRTGDTKKQRALTFHEHEKSLGLNKTNWQSIAQFTGLDDDDQWIGKQIEVYPEWGNWFGKPGWAVRVRPPSGRGTQPQPQQQYQSRPQQQGNGMEYDPNFTPSPQQQAQYPQQAQQYMQPTQPQGQQQMQFQQPQGPQPNPQQAPGR